MRHVTDGELHAYLDGALDLLPEGRGEEIREHLSSCPVCEERLQDEKRIRRQAQELLEEGAPPEVALPPFEEIRARAEAGEASPSGSGHAPEGRAQSWSVSRGFPLAWAATVILALGVGWMGGEVWRSLPQDGSGFVISEPPSAEEAVISPASRGEEGQERESGAGEPGGLENRTATEGPKGREKLVQQEDARALSTPLADQRGEPESAASAPPAAESLQLEEALDPSRVVTREMAEAGTLAAGRTAPSAEVGVPEAEPSVRSRIPATAAPELMEAEGSQPDHSLALPGFEVLSVEWEEWVPGERNLHIRQLLPMGDTLELRYLGMLMGTDPNPAPEEEEEAREGGAAVLNHPPLPQVMEASLPPGWNQVVMKKGRGWLVARAPLTVEHLRALLRAFR